MDLRDLFFIGKDADRHIRAARDRGAASLYRQADRLARLRVEDEWGAAAGPDIVVARGIRLRRIERARVEVVRRVVEPQGRPHRQEPAVDADGSDGEACRPY